MFKKRIKNILGTKTKHKLVAFFVDDFGSIRTKDRLALEHFIEAGIPLTQNNFSFSKYDTLADSEDLSSLFDVLRNVKDANGNFGCFTPFTLVANPDFDAIRKSDFMFYCRESLIETLNKYGSAYHDVFNLWLEGIKEKIFFPQYHGREHLNIKRWMESLNDPGDKITKLGFDYGVYGMPTNLNASKNFMGAFSIYNDEQKSYYETILKDGLDKFKNIFSYSSMSFIPPQYLLHENLESCLVSNGVKYLQGLAVRKYPTDKLNVNSIKRLCWQGKMNNNGLIYLTRNAFFEPTINPQIDWKSDILNRVKLAFKFGKPITISTHRLNFIGSINKKNRDSNIVLFKSILENIIDHYPKVEFLTSVDLGDLISETR